MCPCACAGMNIGFEAIADLPLASLRRQLEVNLVGQICVTQVSPSDCTCR